MVNKLEGMTEAWPEQMRSREEYEGEKAGRILLSTSLIAPAGLDRIAWPYKLLAIYCRPFDALLTLAGT